MKTSLPQFLFKMTLQGCRTLNHSCFSTYFSAKGLKTFTPQLPLSHASQLPRRRKKTAQLHSLNFIRISNFINGQSHLITKRSHLLPFFFFFSFFNILLVHLKYQNPNINILHCYFSHNEISIISFNFLYNLVLQIHCLVKHSILIPISTKF